MKVSKPKTPKVRKELLRNFITTLFLLGSLAFIMYLVAGSISAMLFVNRTSEREVVALRYTNPNIPFTCSDVIVNISGQRIVSLNLSSQTQIYCLYSENFTSSEIRDVGVLMLNGKESPVLWPSEVDDEKERIIYGKFVSFYKLGTRESVPVLVVESFREPSLLDQIATTNRLTLFHIAVVFTILTTASALAVLGVGVWLSLLMEEERKK